MDYRNALYIDRLDHHFDGNPTGSLTEEEAAVTRLAPAPYPDLRARAPDIHPQIALFNSRMIAHIDHRHGNGNGKHS